MNIFEASVSGLVLVAFIVLVSVGSSCSKHYDDVRLECAKARTPAECTLLFK